MPFTSNPIASIAVKRGAVGPAGPAGPDGPAGPIGPQGKSMSASQLDAYIKPAVQSAIGNDFDLVSVYHLNT